MHDPIQPTQVATPHSPVCHPDGELAKRLQPATKLLISVRNVQEAALVRDAGVDWIDLKEPQSGALGRASLSEAHAVAELLKDHPQRSAALGELVELDEQVAFDFAPLFPFLKVGLSHLGCGGRSGSTWQARFESLARQLRKRGAELIPVAYADWLYCDAPSLQEVVRVAQRVGASHLLVDTFIKDSRGLLDWLNLDDLQRVVEALRAVNCGTVLAGSLKIVNAPQLLRLQPAALAVRGAVCQSSAATPQSVTCTPSRITPIDLGKVELWCSSVCGNGLFHA